MASQQHTTSAGMQREHTNASSLSVDWLYIPHLRAGAPAHWHQAAEQHPPGVSHLQKAASPLPASMQREQYWPCRWMFTRASSCRALANCVTALMSASPGEEKGLCQSSGCKTSQDAQGGKAKKTMPYTTYTCYIYTQGCTSAIAVMSFCNCHD